MCLCTICYQDASSLDSLLSRCHIFGQSGVCVYAYACVCVCVCVRVRRPFTTIANCGRESETLNFMLTLKCVSGVDFVPNSPQ